MTVHEPRQDGREVAECRVLPAVGAAYAHHGDPAQVDLVGLDDGVDEVLSIRASKVSSEPKDGIAPGSHIPWCQS